MADDDESLDDILSGSTTPEITTEEQQPEATQPARDEHGRFAPKAEAEPETEEQEQPEGEQPEADEHPDKKAPPGLLEERRKRQEANARADKLERDLAEMRGRVDALMQRGNQPAPQPKEPVKAPEIWEDPNAFVQHALSPVQQQLVETRFMTSRAVALAEHGKDVVSAAETALEQAVKAGTVNGEALKAQLMKSRDPVGDVVRWHQDSPAVRETAMRSQIEAEILAKYGIDPTKAQPTTVAQPSNRNPVVKLPPSLSRIPAGHSIPERDESLDEVLSQPRRRA